jgi:hypothetical protein
MVQIASAQATNERGIKLCEGLEEHATWSCWASLDRSDILLHEACASGISIQSGTKLVDSEADLLCTQQTHLTEILSPGNVPVTVPGLPTCTTCLQRCTRA